MAAYFTDKCAILTVLVNCIRRVKMETHRLRHPSAAETADAIFTQQTIIPRSFMRWMRVFGLFPYPTCFLCHNAQRINSPRFRVQRVCWLVWTAVFWVALILFFLMQEYDYFKRVSSLLVDLEFFTLIAFEFKSVMVLQGPYMVTCMLFISGRIPGIMTEAQVALRRLLKKRDITRLRRYTVGLITFSVISIGVCVIGKLMGLIALTRANYYYEPGVRSPYFFNALTVDPEVHYATHLLGIFLTVTCELLPPTLLLIFMVYFHAGFQRLNRRLADWGRGEVDVDAHRLRQLFRVYSGLSGVVTQLGRVFGPVVLVGCLKDVFTWAALSGTLLQVAKGEWKEVERFAQAHTYIKNMEIVTFTYTAIGLCNMAVRMVVFLAVYDQAQSIRKYLTRIAAESDDEKVLIECNRITVHLSTSDGALSVCGLFDLTKEYIIAFIGLAVTYLLLIYQTRDSRKDIEGMKEMLKRQEMVLNSLWNATVHGSR
ncbi:uncharacterized protein LOC129601403 [Paramacrobiotus metropolitanus]|uniref:uncharacterized protein LOC129601403 n=1 Tax=Paramacrobiotus metropolitanus TaxID=2943436 RepID=UPI0024457EEA|nr:uncharacterized protein LOC129601403 [Paramacrobiotus metropolitanus]